MPPQNTAMSESAMIIEDEKDLCYLLTIVLKKNNVPSACVYSIKEASESIKEYKAIDHLS